MKSVPYVLITLLTPLVLCMFGCIQNRTMLPPARFISSTNEDPPADTANFDNPFILSSDDVMNGEYGGLAVSVAKAFADSTGGDWVVIAPNSLESVKGLQTDNPLNDGNPVPLISVKNEIDQIIHAGTPIAYDSTRHYVYMVFGSRIDLEKYRSTPPDPVTGIYLRGQTLKSALEALADSRHEQISVDSSLDNTWSGYVHRYGQIETQLSQVEAQDSLTYNGGQMQVTVVPQVEFEYMSVRRMSEMDMMNDIALRTGANVQQSSPGSWQFKLSTDGPEQQNAVSKIKSQIMQAADIDDDSSGDSGVHTSYSERHSGSTDATPVLMQNHPTADQLAQLASQIDSLSQVQEPVATCLKELALSGADGTTALAGFLNINMPPQVTCGAMLSLASEDVTNANARKAVTNYIGLIADKVINGNLSLNLIAELRYGLYLMRAQSEIDGTFGQDARYVLAKTAVSSSMPSFLSSFARAALLEDGIVPGKDAPWIPGAEETFALTPPPAAQGILQPIGSTPPDAIRPLAIATASNGDVWGVFCSGRLGNPMDLWLARSVNGRWCEFLFTGQEYVEGEQYGVDNGPSVGGCVLQIIGADTVIIKPSSPAALKLSNLTHAYSKAVRSNSAAAASLSSQLNTLQQSVGTSLCATHRLSVAQLRKDSDGDGLTDIVETRLGTDPQNRETSNNRVSDSADQNPLISHTLPADDNLDRQSILEKIFDALYGSSTEADPIVVLLDKPFQQQFHGGGARVLCVSPSRYLANSSNFLSLRALHFGGPTDSKSTILHPDGPCLYSSDGTSAEVHFWTTTGSVPVLRAPQATTDFIAIFARNGDGWNLKSIEPWHFSVSSSASLSNIVDD